MAHEDNYLELTIPMEPIANEYMILPTIVKRDCLNGTTATTIGTLQELCI